MKLNSFIISENGLDSLANSSPLRNLIKKYILFSHLNGSFELVSRSLNRFGTGISSNGT
jgi:hypothetical protein